MEFYLFILPGCEPSAIDVDVDVMLGVRGRWWVRRALRWNATEDTDDADEGAVITALRLEIRQDIYTNAKNKKLNIKLQKLILISKKLSQVKIKKLFLQYWGELKS